MSRPDGARLMAEPPYLEDDVLDLVRKRLEFSADEFEAVMDLPKASYQDFRTYKRRFELLRPFFWSLYKLERVPKSFYVKFCTSGQTTGRRR